MLIVVPTEQRLSAHAGAGQAARSAVGARRRRGDRSRARGTRSTNANADDVAGTLGGLGAGVSRGGSGRRARRAGGRRAPTPSARRRGGQRRACSRATCASPRTSRPTRWSSSPSGRDYITVRDLIKKLDMPRRQVFVEATILEISIDKTRKLGVALARRHRRCRLGQRAVAALRRLGAVDRRQLDRCSRRRRSRAWRPACAARAIPGADTILGLPPGTSVPSFGVFMQALQNNGDVNVVSMPHILTTDNEKATIQVGQNLPFPGSLGGFPASAARRTGAAGASRRRLRLRHLGAAPGRRAQARDHAARQRLRLRAPRDRQRDLRRGEPELQRPRSGDDQAHGQVGRHHSRSAVDRARRPHQGSRVRDGRQGAAARRHPDPRLSLQAHRQDASPSRTCSSSSRRTSSRTRPICAASSSASCASGASSWSATRRSTTSSDYEAEVDYRRKRGLLEEINLHGARGGAGGDRAAQRRGRCCGRDIDGRGPVDAAAPPTPSAACRRSPGRAVPSARRRRRQTQRRRR